MWQPSFAQRAFLALSREKLAEASGVSAEVILNLVNFVRVKANELARCRFLSSSARHGAASWRQANRTAPRVGQSDPLARSKDRPTGRT